MLIKLHLWGGRKRSIWPQNISNCFKNWTSIFNWAKHEHHKRKWKKLKCSHTKRCSTFRVRNLKTKTSRQLTLKTAKTVWRKKSLAGKTGIITLSVWQFQVNLIKSYNPEILVNFQEKKKTLAHEYWQMWNRNSARLSPVKGVWSIREHHQKQHKKTTPAPVQWEVQRAKYGER